MPHLREQQILCFLSFLSTVVRLAACRAIPAVFGTHKLLLHATSWCLIWFLCWLLRAGATLGFSRRPSPAGRPCATTATPTQLLLGTSFHPAAGPQALHHSRRHKTKPSGQLTAQSARLCSTHTTQRLQAAALRPHARLRCSRRVVRQATATHRPLDATPRTCRWRVWSQNTSTRRSQHTQ